MEHRKPLPASKLRNEIHQDATVEDLLPDVRVPYNDPFIAETQLVAPGSDLTQDGADGNDTSQLSPNSYAIMNRCASSRRVVDTSPIPIKLLSAPVDDQGSAFIFTAFAKNPLSEGSSKVNTSSNPPLGLSQGPSVMAPHNEGFTPMTRDTPSHSQSQSHERANDKINTVVTDKATQDTTDNPANMSIQKPPGDSSKAVQPITRRSPRSARITQKGNNPVRSSRASSTPRSSNSWPPWSNHDKRPAVYERSPLSGGEVLDFVSDFSVHSAPKPEMNQPLLNNVEQHQASSAEPPNSPMNLRDSTVKSMETHKKFLEGAGVDRPHNAEESVVRHDVSIATAREQAAEPVLHRVSSRDSSPQVTKPSHTRKTIASKAHGETTPSSMSTLITLQNAFDTVRSAVHESSRIEKKRASEEAAAKAVITALADANHSLHESLEEKKASEMNLRQVQKHQSAKVKELQKYLQGLGNDYHKMNKERKTELATYKGVVEKEFSRMRKENSALEDDFHKTIAFVEERHRRMKSVMDDAYMKLRISELEREVLMEELKRRDRFLEDEKKKRVDLEQQVRTSFQGVQRRLEESNRDLFEKLSTIQTSVEVSAANRSQDVCLKKCIEELQGLRSIPFLTLKDVKKAETMLRYAYENLDSQFKHLSTSFGATQISTTNIEASLKQQIQSLRTEILNYEKVNLELQKACQSNELLANELQTRKERCEQLDAQVKVLRQSESDLQSQYSEIKLELDGLKSKVVEDQPCNDELESENASLHLQLKKIEDDLQLAVNKLDDTEQQRQAEESSTAHWRNLALEHEQKLTECTAREKKVG
ncbi:hypothetical protein GQ43DRAFT_297989 [Delitschia confertaspora ATCC 74209]|uniref:Uncharacterized protein n=1 Tax=Delitschia confertaspora ATCC 74209 TaxID=1513339 RepID=A0A9P4MTR7_9PLEO|nr:hypothetical protein GQ43DRAFT_297989 [Delitschia confertaspora ATCC 74209]